MEGMVAVRNRVNPWSLISLALVFVFTLSPAALAAELPFEDVTEDDVHYEAVDLLYRTGITAGVSET